MGLDVSVYRNYKVIERNEENVDEDGYFEGDYDFHVYQAIPEWNYKCEELEIDEYYTADRICHSISYPYSSHMWFRKELLKLIGRDDLIKGYDIDWDGIVENTDMDFYEFINFSDCEGTLDSKISKVILGNFLKYEDKVRGMDREDRFVNCYDSWIETFTEGSKDNSVVIFR